MSSLTVTSDDFFADFPDFEYNDDRSLKSNFQRLAKSQGWEGKEYREQMSRMMEGEFRRFYGRSTSLAGWKALSKDLGVEPAPASIDECKEELTKLFVNIWDFVDWKREAEAGREDFDGHFATLDALRTYTKDTGKFYPKDEAKQDGYLWVLLRLILVNKLRYVGGFR
ncbi:hypothetical protein EG328_007497 [Venturia inaequalis]|uniref:Uncharacterized protein n=1 Tax=Venturia inaequalis TaxID=5025 RepID=A0A8H3UE93_VENIN|nr:hypothetical protein EG328_007497 [Venturia inaequalis]